jgi:hypothetical protein
MSRHRLYIAGRMAAGYHLDANPTHFLKLGEENP